MEVITIAKLFLVLRERLCDGDNPHPMRKHFTVKEMGKLSKKMDAVYKGNNE